MITFLLCTACFVMGVVFGVFLGAAIIGLATGYNRVREFDGGYKHDNSPPVRTIIVGGGVVEDDDRKLN